MTNWEPGLGETGADSYAEAVASGPWAPVPADRVNGLPIPDESIRAVCTVHSPTYAEAPARVDAIARPVLIAWLYREAEGCDTEWERAAFVRSAMKLEADS